MTALCTANWLLILEYLKVLLSWPPIVALLGILTLMLFREQIGDLIRKIKLFKGLGIQAEMDVVALQAGSPPAEILPSAPNTLELASAMESGSSLTASLSVEPSPDTLEIPLTPEEELERKLRNVVHHPDLAYAEIKRLKEVAHFEWLWARIITSQVRLLSSLSLAGSSGMRLDDMFLTHLQFSKKLPEPQRLPMRAFLRFLVDNRLIEATPKGDDGFSHFVISPYGKAFLAHVSAEYGGVIPDRPV